MHTRHKTRLDSSTYIFPAFLGLFYVERHRPDPWRNHLWSVLVGGVPYLWRIMRLHICHTSCKSNNSYSDALFSQDAEYNAYYQPRHTGENRSEIALARRFLHIGGAGVRPPWAHLLQCKIRSKYWYVCTCLFSNIANITIFLAKIPTYFMSGTAYYKFLRASLP